MPQYSACLTALACALSCVVAQEDEEKTAGIGQMIQSAFGLAFFISSVVIFYHQRKQKQYVEFQSFDAPTPSDMANEVKESKSSTFTTSTTTNMKEISFDEGNSGPSPGQKKRRKRKAHRLSDRRRNAEDEISQEVEQDSQL